METHVTNSEAQSPTWETDNESAVKNTSLNEQVSRAVLYVSAPGCSWGLSQQLLVASWNVWILFWGGSWLPKAAPMISLGGCDHTLVPKGPDSLSHPWRCGQGTDQTPLSRGLQDRSERAVWSHSREFKEL